MSTHPNTRLRIVVLFAALIGGTTVILGRLAQIQLGEHEFYRIRSHHTHRMMEMVDARRGTISDGKGVVLAEDIAAFDIYADVRNKRLEKGLGNLSLLLPGRDIPTAAEIKARKRRKKTVLVPVAKGVGYAVAEKILLFRDEYPGIVVKLRARRRYPLGRTACHVIGYVGPLRAGEPEHLIPLGYRLDDIIGRAGVEKVYEKMLRARRGGRIVEVDARTGEETTLLEVPAHMGKDLRLTIEIDIQRAAEAALEECGKPSSAVLMDVHTGAVLAMASYPFFEPQAFVPPRKNALVRRYFRDRRHPLLNRAIQGAYPLGSIFKLITATAALETGTITENTQFNCMGAYHIGRWTFRCWKRTGHGMIDVRDAIKVSCNVFFFTAADKMGGKALSEWASRFGLGRKTGIDLPFESAGRLPVPGKTRRWSRGQTVNLAIGQGALLVTPIQAARLTAAIANGGKLVRPHVLSSTTIETTPVGARPETLRIVREGMWRVVNAPHGTGIKCRLEEVAVAGKTATAQAGRGEDHAWFAAFAPYERPRVCVVVQVEHGGHGGEAAAPVAARILETYFRLHPPEKTATVGMLDVTER